MPKAISNHQLSRRALIGGIVSASVLSAPALAKSVEQENQELLDLGQRFDAAMTDYRKAKARNDNCRAIFEATKPQVPDELVLTYPDPEGWNYLAETERDIDGTTIYPPNVVRGGKQLAQIPRKILSAALLEEATKDHSARSRLGKKIRQRLEIAKKFEAKVEAAATASSVKVASEALYFAEREVEEIIGDVAKANALTIEGIRLKARVIDVAVTELQPGHFKVNAPFWIGAQMAKEILAVTG